MLDMILKIRFVKPPYYHIVSNTRYIFLLALKERQLVTILLTDIAYGDTTESMRHCTICSPLSLSCTGCPGRSRGRQTAWRRSR